MEGNTSCFSSLPPSGLAFRKRYMQRFLPLLSCIRERNALKRYRAVRKAAGFSLACTAGRTSWSEALCRSLFGGGHVQKHKTQAQTSCSSSSLANEAGLAFLKRLRRSRIRARLQRVNYRKHFLQAQKKQVIGNGKLEDALFSSRPNMSNQHTGFEASKLSSLCELIPGGRCMDLPELLDQTAHYIISLKLQVDALAFLGRTISC